MIKVTVDKTPGTWTAVTLTAGVDNLIQCRSYGVYLTTDGTTPADKTLGFALADGSHLVVSGDLTINAHTINDLNDSELVVGPIGA